MSFNISNYIPGQNITEQTLHTMLAYKPEDEWVQILDNADNYETDKEKQLLPLFLESLIHNCPKDLKDPKANNFINLAKNVINKLEVKLEQKQLTTTQESIVGAAKNFFNNFSTQKQDDAKSGSYKRKRDDEVSEPSKKKRDDADNERNNSEPYINNLPKELYELIIAQGILLKEIRGIDKHAKKIANGIINNSLTNVLPYAHKYPEITKILREYSQGNNSIPLTETRFNIVTIFQRLFRELGKEREFEELYAVCMYDSQIFKKLAERLADLNLEKAWSRIKNELQNANPTLKFPNEEINDAKSIRNFLKNHKAECEQVTSLNLVYLGLIEIPKELFDFTNLTDLRLDQNFIYSLPKEISTLSKLQKLSLIDNKLTYLPPEIGQLTALEELELSENNILTSIPKEIGQLTALKKLVLGENKLTDLPAEIGRLRSLKHLYLYNNLLTSLPVEFGQLKALEILKLSNNKLTDLPPEIGQFTALEILDLKNNKLTDLPPEIGHLKVLHTLYIGGNNIEFLPSAIEELAASGSLKIRRN